MRLFLGLFLLISCERIWAQDPNIDEHLARSFFELRDYEKADALLKKLFPNNPEKYYDMSFKTAMSLKHYDEAIAIATTAGKKSKQNLNYQYDLGLAYFKKNDSIQGDKIWMRAIDNALENMGKTHELIQIFQLNKNWNYLEKILRTAIDKKYNPEVYSAMLMDVLLGLKKYPEVVPLLMNKIEKDEVGFMNTILRIQNYTEELELMSLVQKRVYSEYAKNQNSEKWTQIAMWLSQVTKDYEEALHIAMAYDKRLHGNGNYVLSVADVALHEEEYRVSIAGYQYLKNIETNNMMAKLAAQKEIEAYYSMVKKSMNQDSSSMDSMQVRMNAYFSKYGMDHTTAEMQILQAEVWVRYYDKLSEAIALLIKLLDYPQLPLAERSRATLNLGDYKLIADDIWEASLLYGKVDKDEKDSPLGEEARFKNSKVFYFNGDFELAGDLLSILKSSTSELLANDALYLSVFIQDNRDNDTLNTAMREVSKAELLFYQNKQTEALQILSAIKSKYPKSTLIDDILMIEALEASKQKKWGDAIAYYQEIMDRYSGSILADKAIYEWSKIQETIYQDKTKAMDGYLKILTKYKDSVYSTDARKRLRALRGEKEMES